MRPDFYRVGGAETCAGRRSERNIPAQMSAAMRIRDRTARREAEAFVVHMGHARYCAWRQRVETFAAVHGVRPLLANVPDVQWFERFAANEDAYSAVVSELGHID